MNVVAYVRVSTDGQVGDDKFGIDSQKKIVSEYCAKHDMTISQWYIDKGESGVKENRPQLDALLYGDVKNPPVEGVVVAKSDRIARDIKLYYYFMMLLNKKGMELYSATEEVVNDDTGLGSVYKALMLFVAEQERANITKRTSGGRTVKASRGGYSGGKPAYGYRALGGRLEIEPNEAEVVKTIFRMREQEGALYRNIVEYLNENGIPTKTGKVWASSSVQSIIENKKTYQGYYKYGNDQWVRGQHEAIIEEDTENGGADK